MRFRTLTVSVAIAIVHAIPRAEHLPAAAAQSGVPTSIVAYQLDVQSIPGFAGIAGLRIAVRGSSSTVIRTFEVVDEKPFHLFIVSRDLRFFRHLYPALLPDGFLEARESIPPGEYLVAADFLPAGGARQFLQRVIDLRGELRGNSPAPQKGQPGDDAANHAYDIVTNVRVQPLKTELTAGQQAPFHVVLSRTEDGRPIVNLEPYLGTGGYLLAVKNDLTEAVRARASLDDLPVSLLTFDMTLSKAGSYTAWVEFQRFGETLTARLAVTAR